MSWIPGWNSIGAAGWWSGFFFWASIGCLIGLGITEVASHRYSERKDDLAEIEQREIQRRHDDDMARVQHDTAQANERAAELAKEAARLSAEAEAAKAQIAEANKIAKEAQERTEIERLQRLKLEQQVAPRQISQENQRGMANELGQISGKSVDVISYSLDLESSILATQIIESLKLANATINDRRSSIMPLGGFVAGVHLSGPNKDDVELLAIALNAFGRLVIKIDDRPQVAGGNPDAITILVGPKPPDLPADGLIIGTDNLVFPFDPRRRR